jgi:hypothetical protein
MKKYLTLLAVLLLSLAPSATTQARGISWFSAVGDIFLMADGTTKMDSTMTFELGGFSSGFTPSLANLSLWQSNWIVFDIAVDGDGWNPDPDFSNYGGLGTAVAAASGFITSSDTGATFGIGQQAYVWTYNSKTISPTSEWALITNAAWTYPVASTSIPDPLEWGLGHDGTTALVGGTSTDGGTFVSTLQTQAVPEPGSALLILVAGVMIRLRRRYGR